MSEDEEPERLSSPKLVIMANSLAKRDSIDGYDGDTDTLKSKKGSVKRNTSAVHEAASSSQFTTTCSLMEPGRGRAEESCSTHDIHPCSPVPWGAVVCSGGVLHNVQKQAEVCRGGTCVTGDSPVERQRLHERLLVT